MATGLPPELIAALAQQQAGGGPPGAPPMGMPPLAGARPPMGLPPPAMLAAMAHPQLRHMALRRPAAPAGPAGLAGALRGLVP